LPDDHELAVRVLGLRHPTRRAVGRGQRLADV